MTNSFGNKTQKERDQAIAELKLERELSPYIVRFANNMMKHGNSSKSFKIIEQCMTRIYKTRRQVIRGNSSSDLSKLKLFQGPFMESLYFMVRRVRPFLYLKKVVMQGKPVTLPGVMTEEKELSIGLNWLGRLPVTSRDSMQKSAADCFFNEFLNVYARKGVCFKYRTELNKKIALSYLSTKKSGDAEKLKSTAE